MSQIVEAAHQQVREVLLRALGEAVAAGELPNEPIPAFAVEVPGDRTHGDLAANIAMVSARALHRAPRQIAEALLAHLSLADTYLERAEVAGPGFLNFFLSPAFYAGVTEDVLRQEEHYGRSDHGQGQRILVEFVSANPTGPMHIGNARGGALGDCLASVLNAAGYEASREFYVNDAGNQIEKFKLSLETRYLQLFDPSVEMPEDAYLGEDITAHARAFAELYGDRYVHEDSEVRRQALCDFALPENIQKLKDDLAKYRIHYDRWFLESSLHESGAVMAIVEKLRELGHTYEQDGAVWFRSTAFGDEKDRVLVRANGIPTYLVPDIAYQYNKLVERGYDIAIDVLGADHHGYVPRMRAALQALGVDPKRLDVIIMQMVRLVKNGEVYKLSKRSGKAITLETLLDEVPIDAARFFFNQREPNTHLEFDMDLAVEQSSQNPVYYVQYAHARICSIFKKYAAEGNTYVRAGAGELEALNAPEERELIRHLAALTGEIVAAADERDPSRMTRYSTELATLFHKFYNNCRIFGAEEPLLRARLTLCEAVAIVLRNVLTLLGIEAPESM